MSNAIKWVLILLLLVGGFYFFVQQQEVSSQKVSGLPWMVKADADRDTQVFGMHIGKDTLSEIGPVLGKLPELAIFQNKEGQRTLEAYFSRVKIGHLQANIVAVLDIDQDNLSTFADFEKTGKPMPSGLRKYSLSLAGLKASSALTVWKLAYIPVADYTEKQLLAFFGEPEKKTPVSTQGVYWHYPSKALLIAYDREGKEIFHYTSKDNYQRLMTELLMVVDEK